MKPTLLKLSLLGLSLICATGNAHAQGSIIYNDPPDISLFTASTAKTYDLDMDQNGTVDYRLVNGSGEFVAYGIGQNASWAVPETPPDLGAFITPLAHGNSIGPPGVPPNAWFQTYSLEPLPGLIVTIPAYFHGCTTRGCIGTFHNVTAYWGVQFDINGNTHYGWVRVATAGLAIPGGSVLDWAYNSIPGQSILAGQVPEPGTVALLVAGGGFLCWRWRRVPAGGLICSGRRCTDQ